MRPAITLSACLVLLFAAGPAYAQQSVWEGGREKMTSVKEKGAKQVSKVKQWQKHIREWGLDSNYRHALALGLRLNTNGWSGGLSYLRNESPGKKVIWQLYFSGLQHEKEVKQQRRATTYNYLAKNTSYSLGKIYNAYTLQLAYGREQMLFPALIDGNLSLSLRYAAGPALALLKPYYLNLLYVTYTPEEHAYVQSERFTGANASQFLNPAYVLGSDKWSKGLGETRLIPGLFAELAIALEPGRPESFVKTITIGGNAAFYTSKIEIMAERKAYPYQACFFVGLAFGKRWK
ncbi:hypothetical protein [Taibaiella chishuiensis]|uniref:Outer membrane beta-barrel porin/alpha-amylase n=1 Tax=Taibaiella chishuiensis TaxID=1434707 RepID=A0A2P8D7Y5_9BACT|nr:hypothetical protein [Taibaiella chishuiensis]PSK93307.1 hypothetical protein B0I18_102277 [Taibaiella chishuiensis]